MLIFMLCFEFVTVGIIESKETHSDVITISLCPCNGLAIVYEKLSWSMGCENVLYDCTVKHQ